MASEANNVRILTQSEQKQAIKKEKLYKKFFQNPKKSIPKKNVPKSYLESPFALEWPKLTPEDEEEVINLLRKSCLGLKKIVYKPQWKDVAKYRGAERKAFLKENYQKFLENLDPDSIKKNKEREEAVSHLIFGYNSVMKALEQDCIAGILLMKDVKPDFVIKAFLPACAKKCIPLVPLNDLEKALRDEETLALSHTCMALGLKPSVKEEFNRFHPLYAKMCEALNIEEGDEDSSVEEEGCIESLATDKKEKESSKPLHQLSEEDISAYHLKRSAERGRRAFIPEEKLVVKSTGRSKIALIFADVQPQKDGPDVQASTTKPEETDNNKSGNLKASPAIDENVDFSSMILIDTSGDENPSAESSVVKQQASDVEKPTESNSIAKRKRKIQDCDAYVPATTKLIRGNPNRKGIITYLPGKTKQMKGHPPKLNQQKEAPT